jgi:uncharacterized protein YxeA
MSQTSKIIFTVIVTAIIVGGGVYYWQNSTSLQTPVIKETNQGVDKLSTANESGDKQKEETPIKTTESTDKTKNWKTYSNLGVSIKYPNDGSYSIETPEISRFIITQDHPGNRIHISKTIDSLVLSDNEKTKVIDGNSYKVFYREGMGSGYGYVIERNGQFYAFESIWGPENEVFELMMTTVKFE